MIVELRDKDVGEKPRAGHAAWDRAARSRLLDHALAAAARLLHPSDLDHLDLRRNHVEQFTDVLADHAQATTAIGTRITGIELAALTRRILGDAWTATRSLFRRESGLLGRRQVLVRDLGFFKRRIARLRLGHHQIFERQFELLDLARDLLRAGAKLQLLQLRDPDPQRLNE